MRRFTLGTAGHIDHGKTTLVAALTGTDTDRLPEEKRRGITIDLGFAVLPLADDLELDLVDVPGHEAFVRNMLAGATGVDMIMLVVAADEGVMPQTREHLAIASLLGVHHGVVALTRADLVDGDWLELAREDVAALIAHGPFRAAPIVPVSGRTGEGMDKLRQALCDVARTLPGRSADDLVRLPVDRVFTVKGTGTVVTGTLWSGRLRRDDRVLLQPGGRQGRVRALHRHGAPTDQICAGERGAVALTGLARADIERGMTLVTETAWEPTQTLTVLLEALPSAAPLVSRQRVRVHLGTAERFARLALADSSIQPGAQGLAQLRLEAPILARAGDRLVIRSWSPPTTIGGGLVIEPLPPRRHRRLEAALRETLGRMGSGAGTPEDFFRLMGKEGVATVALPILAPAALATAIRLGEAEGTVRRFADRLLPAAAVAEAQTAILLAVDAFHQASPVDEGLDREQLRQLLEDGGATARAGMQELLDRGDLAIQGNLLRRPDHVPRPGPTDAAPLRTLAAALAEAGSRGVDASALATAAADHARLLRLLRFMERSGQAVRIASDRWAEAAAISGAISSMRSQLPAGQPLTIAELRPVLQLSRKDLLPLLEYLDRIGVTTREGDARILLPSPPTEGPANQGLSAS
jgi:selenocysteine-specific elongation factor